MLSRKLLQILGGATASALLAAPALISPAQATAAPATAAQATAAPATAAPATPALPQPVFDGSIVYLTGGIGQAEQHALKSDAGRYDLAITNANARGDFTTGTDLVIADSSGHSVLSVDGTGPLFYAELPAGRYTIRATNDGVTRVRQANLLPDTLDRLHLVWPQAS